MTALSVIASFHPKPGKEDEVERVLRGMVGPTRAEMGCKRYDLYRSESAPTCFVLFEIYEGQPALEAHRGAEHYKAYRARIADLLSKPISVQVLAGLDVN